MMSEKKRKPFGGLFQKKEKPEEQETKDLVKQDEKKKLKLEKITINSDNPLSMMAFMVQAGTLTIDQMKEFKKMHDEIEAEKARKSYFVALSEFQAVCPVIEKRKKGWNNNYRYAPYEDIWSQTKELLKQFGFSYTTNQKQTEKLIEMTGYLHHIDGHTELATLSAPWDDSGGKNVIQSIGSTETYLRRYLFIDLTGLGTADGDDDGKSYPDSFADDTPANKKIYHYAIIGLLSGKVFTDQDREKFKAIYKAGGFKSIQDYQRNYSQTLKEKQKREKQEKDEDMEQAGEVFDKNDDGIAKCAEAY